MKEEKYIKGRLYNLKHESKVILSDLERNLFSFSPDEITKKMTRIEVLRGKIAELEFVLN